MCRDNLQTCFTSDAQVIPGQDGRAIDALCWVGQRLFSAGLNGKITEYDLENLRPKYTMEAYGGPIWTISSNSQGTLLTVSHDMLHIKFHPGSCFLGSNLSDKPYLGFSLDGDCMNVVCFRSVVRMGQ